MNREEAIQMLKALNMMLRSPDGKPISDACDALGMAIEALSRPHGEWIEKGGELVCSVCGNSVSFSRTPKGWVLGKFCQSCGARMKGGDDK